MRYKALILDLDGTTLPQGIKSKVSNRVKDAIFKAKDIVDICIATGRSMIYARSIINELKLTSPCIIASGVQVYDPLKKIFIYENELNPKTISQIIKVKEEIGLKLNVYDGETDYEFTPDYNGKILSLFFPKVPYEKNIILEKKLSQLRNVSLHKMPSWENNLFAIDITNSNASKLHALITVFKIIGVSKNETIGVGDSYNDYSLLMACGLKIAMGNAVDEVKAIADFIAPSVEEDGVATIIEKFILCQ